MLFLCEKCHSREKGCLGWDFHAKSRGPCEDCGQTAVCVDCVVYKMEAAAHERVTAEVLAENPVIRPL